ncbi:MAG: FCD domain-containing protein, partial [Achromobacter sp.]|uniref:FCD domain-containing protein n=1 Tax=Achromobacter sp. TaxID=134375 RepID=UPI00258751AD
AGPDPDREDALEARHWEFHHVLIGACRSPWLLDLSAQLYAQTERYRRPALAGVTAYGPQRNVDQEHRLLLEAALSRDADRAAATLAAHYRKTAQFIEQVLEQAGRQAASA